jgi:hypothetical protein
MMRTLLSTVSPRTSPCLRSAWPALYAEIQLSSTMSWRNPAIVADGGILSAMETWQQLARSQNGWLLTTNFVAGLESTNWGSRN